MKTNFSRGELIILLEYLTRVDESVAKYNNEHDPEIAKNPTLADVGEDFVALFEEFEKECGGLSGRGCHLLMWLIWAVLATKSNDEEVRRSARNAAKGKINGERLKRKQAKWADEALIDANKYVAIHPNYSQDKLADYLIDYLNPPVSRGQLKNVISGWQWEGRLPRKTLTRFA